MEDARERLPEELDIPIVQILKVLQSNGIDAKKDVVIRTGAERDDVKAVNIVNMIKENK